MNFKRINIIIGREYLNRVKKKSFLITTFLVPILFAGFAILPSLIMFGAKEEAKTVAVVDESGIVLPYLDNTSVATYVDVTSEGLDAVKSDMSRWNADAVLYISAVDANKNLSASSYSEKPLGMDLTESIDARISEALEAYRVASYEIEGLEEIMASIKANVHISSYTISADGTENISETTVYMMVSMILGMVIYMFIAMFGGMVMGGVIEEKNSRVVEVLVSSVKAIELMFGKIIGIALVALTQFVLWIALAAVIMAVAGNIIGVDSLSALAADPSVADLASAGISAEIPSEVSVILSTLANINIAQIIICFFGFFIFGYLLYASLYAAIGSAVENEGDASQLQMPVTIPLLLAFFIAFYAFKAPDSSLVFWGSMIPFTSPIVMLARLPYGVATWEILVSFVLLVATFCGAAYVSAKIYKVGILMFGKKSTFKDLWKWLKLK